MKHEELLKIALENKEIKAFVKENQIPEDVLLRDAFILYSFKIHKEKCSKCQGLDKCVQGNTGKKPVLKYGDAIYVDYEDCDFESENNIERRTFDNLYFFASDFEKLDPSTIYSNVPARNEIYLKMKQIFDDVEAGKKPKGVYLYGPYGTGKTFILASFAYKFAESGKKVIFAYYPDLVRELKSSIATGGLEDLVDALKEIDVLFLDDFGGELSTPFIRDEVLGAVLQERMVNNRLTFMTSNLDKKSLHEHLAETAKDIDELKASRIEERIRVLMDFVLLQDKNYRK